jgi:hypothetical protein
MKARFSRDARAAIGGSCSIHRLGEQQVCCWMASQVAAPLEEEFSSGM